MTGVSIKMRPPAHLVNKNKLMRTESYKRTDIEESWIIIDATEKLLVGLQARSQIFCQVKTNLNTPQMLI